MTTEFVDLFLSGQVTSAHGKGLLKDDANVDESSSLMMMMMMMSMLMMKIAMV